MVASSRPDPDELLALVHHAEREAQRGKLTIFFGAAPGVGKTYAMLEAARLEVSQGRDVVIGLVETHKRYETESMVLGFELLPRQSVEHQGIKLGEFDLDAALARKPALILVDELAHTNAPGSRHRKRWQDVEELLDAGIDVFSTVNVQHIESLNDVVAQITHVIVHETVPDSVLDKAWAVRVVDLPVDELIERLHEGKIYVPQLAQRALQSFFTEGNLIALRELALRRTAERVDAQMRLYKATHGIEETWHTGERVLVCVSPSPHSARLVRAARRMASTLHAELLGVYVETPAALRMSSADRERLARNIRLLEQLGGESVTVRGEDAAEETVRCARKRNVTKIVLGKPTHPRWRDIVKRSFLDDVVRASNEIDVYVISGFDASDAATLQRERGSRPHEPAHAPQRKRDSTGYLAGTVVVVAATATVWWVFGPGELADAVMTYLLGIVLVSMRFGYGPSLFAAVASIVALDFFFVPPYFSFAVMDLRHLITFTVLFLVAFVISHLTQRVREQADRAREREQRTASLYGISRELAHAETRERVLDAAARHVREVFASQVALVLPGAGKPLEIAFSDDVSFRADDKDFGVAEWVWLHQKPAGLETDTLPSARGMFVPLRGARGRVGVLALFPTGELRLRDPEGRHLLDTFAGIIGSALERFQTS